MTKTHRSRFWSSALKAHDLFITLFLDDNFGSSETSSFYKHKMSLISSGLSLRSGGGRCKSPDSFSNQDVKVLYTNLKLLDIMKLMRSWEIKLTGFFVKGVNEKK